MIGQTNNLAYIDNLKEIPHFIILVGDFGSGKTMFAKYISDKLNATMALCGIKVDEIREIIQTAYTVRDNVVYCIKNADTMRAEAKNALLKITEEPPENAYFVLTVTDDSTLLATIKSRAFLVYMEPYTKNELETYFWQTYNEGGNEVSLITDIASTPYEVDMLVHYGRDFIDYVNLVIDNIGYVDSANAFKSGSKLALRTDEGYDLKLFFRTFLNLCELKLIAKGRGNGKTILCKYVLITAESLDKVSRLGVNKQQLYDAWVFAIREVWL